jgi:aspartyl aminopeptidase
MRDCITRVTQLLAGGAEGAVQRAMRNSFLISADMAHALHPNYADKHDPDLAPRLGSGLVLKHNVNQRYATTSISATLFREVCRRAGVPTAEFAVRSDMACGSTIGPILASGLGVRTVDIGVPQLAMHSIREMCAVVDVAHGLKAFTAFFQTISELDRTVDPDTLPPPDIRGTLREAACGHVH